MKNEKLYLKSVDILLDAYNDGKLHHGNCSACAVGNLVSANGGFHGFPVVHEARNCPEWGSVFCSSMEHGQIMDVKYYKDAAKKEIDQTGYSLAELAKIELAFEQQSRNDLNNKTQYHGLCAVLDVLREIHEVEQEAHDHSHQKLKTIYEALAV